MPDNIIAAQQVILLGLLNKFFKFKANGITVADLRQSDRLFLALIDTTRNERLR